MGQLDTDSESGRIKSEDIMAKRKKRKSIFDSIRKQVAPPTQYHQNLKKIKKADVVGRKVKHKGKTDD